MGLTKVETIFKAAPGFNAKAAQEMHDLVMKMDDDSAEVFCRMIAAEVVEETIEKNLRVVQRQVNTIVSKRMETVRKAALRAALKDPEAAVPFAKALSEISKATPYDYGYRFKESDFNRDASTGRFRAKVTTSQKKPIHDRTAASMGIPTKVQANKATTQRRTLSDDRVAAYQDQYRQLANFLGSVAASGNPGDNDVIAHIQDKRTGQKYTTTVTSTRPGDVKWDPANEDLVGLDARPNTLTAGGAYFGLSTALGGDGTSQARMGRTRAINSLDRGMGSFADDWTAAGDAQNSNSQLYNRIKSGSELAGEMSPDGSKRQLAARMGQFVGEHGGEAEAVFGPKTRKTAYRYRGTSKVPDKTMVNEYNRALQAAKMRNASDPYRNTPEGKRANLKAPQHLAPSQMAAQRVMAERRDATFEERAAGRAVIVGHLMDRQRAPKKGLYNLQLASGNTPPSEGVLIGADGKIVDQAVGYGDDHYLPFNLKKLKGLKGGEYIRTRSVGGLTSEDIHTGLMSGAKQVTVVSRSGMFTMTFEDDFKGGRRHNDKARRMTKRYEQLLDAVQSQQVDRKDVSPEIRNGIKAQVMEEMGGYGMSGRELSQEVNRRVQEFKESPELSTEDEALVEAMVRARTSGGAAQDTGKIRSQIMADVAEEKEYKFRLNGAGYAAALEGLREQFPYYISTSYRSLREEDARHEPELDRGYVEPDRNRPTAAAAGLFGARTRSQYEGQGGKFAASNADYQGGSGPRNSPKAPLSPVPEKSVPDKPAFQSAVAEKKQSVEFSRTAQKVQEKLKTLEIEGMSDDDKATLNMSGEDLMKPENQARFDRFVTLVQSKSPNVLGDLGAEYKTASGRVGQQVYENGRAGLWGTKPYRFGGDAYAPGAKTPAIMKELGDIDKRTVSGVKTNKPLSRMSMEELKDEHGVLTEMRAYLDAGEGESLTPHDRAELLSELGVAKGAPGLMRLVNNPSGIGKALEDVHRVRALRDVHPVTLEAGDGDITITNAPPTAEEKLRPAGRVETLENEFRKAEKYYESVNDTDALDIINIAAQTLHEEKPRIGSHADLDELRTGGHPASESFKEAEHLVLRMYEERKRNSGSILG